MKIKTRMIAGISAVCGAIGGGLAGFGIGRKRSKTDSKACEDEVREEPEECPETVLKSEYEALERDSREYADKLEERLRELELELTDAKEELDDTRVRLKALTNMPKKERPARKHEADDADEDDRDGYSRESGKYRSKARPALTVDEYNEMDDEDYEDDDLEEEDDFGDVVGQIPKESYYSDFDDFGEVELWYYSKDGVLSDERDNRVDMSDVEDALGSDGMSIIRKTLEPTIYFANGSLGLKYMVHIRKGKSYAKEVRGVDEDSDEYADWEARQRIRGEMNDDYDDLD